MDITIHAGSDLAPAAAAAVEHVRDVGPGRVAATATEGNVADLLADR